MSAVNVYEALWSQMVQEERILFRPQNQDRDKEFARYDMLQYAASVATDTFSDIMIL